MHWKFFKNLLRTSRPNSIKLGTNYPWMKGVRVCSNKGTCPLQRGDNHKNVKMGWGHLKISRTTGPILTRLGANHPWDEWVQVCSNKGDFPSPRGGNSERVKIHWKILKSFSPEPTGQNQLNFEQIIFGWREFKFVQIDGQVLFKGEIITKNIQKGLGHLKIFFFRTMKPEKLNFTKALWLRTKASCLKSWPPRVGWGKWKWNAYLILEKYIYIGQGFSGERCGPWASC
jgi:hypothetical protein